MDDIYKNETPCQVLEYSGNHKLKLSYPGYIDTTLFVTLFDGVDKEIDINLVKNSGFISLAVEPKMQ